MIVRPYEHVDFDSVFHVYRACEDFLSLGPVAVASQEMVLSDIEHSRQEGGVFCIVDDAHRTTIGVLDFVPENKPGTAFLLLLMIAKVFRGRGYGSELMDLLEAYLRTNYMTRTIESGVQTNNEDGIQFWKKCGFDIGSVAIALDDGTVAYEMKKGI
jgi:ribosomal protein S18 acetylase RimI-like enzyme